MQYNNTTFDELKSTSLMEWFWEHIYHLCAFFVAIAFVILGVHVYQPSISFWVFFMTWMAMGIFLCIPIGLGAFFLTFLLLPFAYLGDFLIMHYLKKHGEFDEQAQDNYAFSRDLFFGLAFTITILIVLYHWLF